MKRFALIFEDRVRPETTGLYCLRAFSRLGSAVHFLPEEIDNIVNNDFDLFLRVDDGLNYEVRSDLHPMIYWAIDTHVSFHRCLEAARSADFVFAAQRNGVELFQQAGIDASWLPLACDPEIHGRQPEPKRLDLCFVGNVLPGIREERLVELAREFPSLYIGKHYFRDMARVYSQSKIVFNQSIASDLNMRLFEALASGSLLVTDDLTCNGMRELFEPGRHLVTFHDSEEMVSKVRYYLDQEDARERIAASGARPAAIASHTYDHRIRTMLDVVESRPQSFAIPPSDVARMDRSYFEHSRPELLELIPLDAERVLDVGCGGVLGEALKHRQPGPRYRDRTRFEAGKLASQRLDGVVEVDIESAGWDFEPQIFDCIVCGSILEHLLDPVRFLGR
ncbi:MAG: glycosyltransferase [Planctomycetota bacterium]